MIPQAPTTLSLIPGSVLHLNWLPTKNLITNLVCIETGCGSSWFCMMFLFWPCQPCRARTSFFLTCSNSTLVLFFQSKNLRAFYSFLLVTRCLPFSGITKFTIFPLLAIGCLIISDCALLPLDFSPTFHSLIITFIHKIVSANCNVSGPMVRLPTLRLPTRVCTPLLLPKNLSLLPFVMPPAERLLVTDIQLRYFFGFVFPSNLDYFHKIQMLDTLTKNPIACGERERERETIPEAVNDLGHIHFAYS